MAIYEVGSMITPILQKEKLRLREITQGKQIYKCVFLFLPFLIWKVAQFIVWALPFSP